MSSVGYRILRPAVVITIWVLMSWVHYHISRLLFAATFASGEMVGGLVVLLAHYLAKGFTTVLLLPIGLPLIYLLPGTTVPTAICVNSPIASVLIMAVIVRVWNSRQRRRQ